jgi:hypothetical protein
MARTAGPGAFRPALLVGARRGRMMSPHRRTGALFALALALGGVLLTAAPARAADVSVEVDPSIVQAGFIVGIQASCTDNTMSATVKSDAFGTVTVQPQNGRLTAAATVPQNTQPGTFRVTLECPDGNTASTTLTVASGAVPSRGPATGFGGTAATDAGTILLAGGLGTIVAGVVLGLYTMRGRPRRGMPREVRSQAQR